MKAETVIMYDVHNPNKGAWVIKRRDIKEPDLVIRGGKTKETRMCRDLRKLLDKGILQIEREQAESTSEYYVEPEFEAEPEFGEETAEVTQPANIPTPKPVPPKRGPGRPKGSGNKKDQ